MPYKDVLRATLANLEPELADLEQQALKVRQAIEAIRALLPEEAAPAIEQPQTPSVASSREIPQPAPDRPLLRDAVPTILAQHPKGLTLPQLAQELWQRGWVGGETKPSAESIRPILHALRQDGRAASKKVRNSHYLVWRLVPPQPSLLDTINASLRDATVAQATPSPSAAFTIPLSGLSRSDDA